MRRIWYGTIWAIGLGQIAAGCSSDEKTTFSSGGSSGASGASSGGGGSSSGGGGSSSKGGSSASDGGSAGSSKGGSSSADGGSAGSSKGGSSASDGGSAGAADGGSGGNANAGSAGVAGGNGGSAGTAADGGSGGEAGAGGCTAASDDCPPGSYCTPEGVCAPGCKNGDDCASGVCGATHDCEHCLADDECAEGNQCATGTCNAACSEAEPASCGGGRTCCGTRCVDTSHDIGHCGACGDACEAQEFCGTDGCLAAVLANVCYVARATALLDGQTPDDASSVAALAALEQGCTPAPVTEAVTQTLAEQINTTSGQVVVSGGELLVFAGGPFFQTAINYLEDARTTPVYSAGYPTVGFYRTSGDVAIRTWDIAESTDSHDVILIQVGREPITGTPSLILYGFSEFGTRAAVWQFENVMLPDLASYTGAYYVYEWTDGDGDHAGDPGEFTLIAP